MLPTGRIWISRQFWWFAYVFAAKTLFSQHVRCNGVRNWMAAMNLYSKQVFLPAVIPRSLIDQVPEFWSIG